LIENKKDLELTIKYHQEILYQYRCIKYNSDYKNKFYFLNVKKAHEKMIDEVKTEKFCNLELEKINNKNCC
jgi:hypothetical protein